MKLITQKDFESKEGQQKIINSIHQLERRIHNLEKETKKQSHQDDFIERDLQGPEAY